MVVIDEIKKLMTTKSVVFTTPLNSRGARVSVKRTWRSCLALPISSHLFSSCCEEKMRQVLKKNPAPQQGIFVYFVLERGREGRI